MRNRLLRRTGTTLMLAGCAIAFVDCSDSVTSPEQTVTTVTLDPPSATLRLGATVQFTAQGLNNTGGVVAGTPTFTSSDSSVVSVSATGLARALKIGTATVTARAGTISKPASVTVTAGFPATVTKAAGDAQTASATSVLPVRPSVQVKDSAGNVVTGASVTFAVASGGGSIAAGTVTTDASGVATAGNWTLGPNAGANTLTATVQGASAPVVATFTATATAAVASQLAVATAPAGAVTNAAFTTQPVIEVRTASGGVVNTATNAVTATISAGGHLIGTSTVNAVNGVARFTNLGALDAGTFTITFAATGLTSATSTVSVAQGPALLAAAVTFTATRGQGEPDGQLALVTSQTGAVISGLTVSSVTYDDTTKGNWLFAAMLGTNTPAYLQLEAHAATVPPGTYVARVTVSGTGATPVVIPVTLTVIGLPPVGLAVATAPSTAKTATPLPAITVQFVDANGQVATQVTDSVTVAVLSGPGPVAGTLKVAAVGGVATFSDLTLSVAGQYTLSFSAPGVTVAFTRPITVSDFASGVAILTAPAGTRNSGDLSTQPVARLVDSHGNTVADETQIVTLTVTGPAGTGVVGTYTATTFLGVAIFSGVAVNGPAGGYVFDFRAGNLPTTASVTVNFP